MNKILELTDKENEIFPMNENFSREVGSIGRETETIKNEPNGNSRTEKHNFWSTEFTDWMQLRGQDGVNQRLRRGQLQGEEHREKNREKKLTTSLGDLLDDLKQSNIYYIRL